MSLALLLYVVGSEKGVILRAGRIFILNRAYLQDCSSYNLQTWCNDSPIIALHSLKIL